MSSIVLQKFFKVFVALTLPLGGFLFLVSFDKNPILIESLESKTETNGSVYNKIQYRPGLAKDIWLMEQSHHGVDAQVHQWDKIAIVVDHSQSPKKAEFFQFENSDTEISMNLKPIAFRVSCYFCHSNGPRAIRPSWASKKAPLSFWDQARLAVWNLRIKSYGLVKGRGQAGQKGFKHPSRAANEKLNVETCRFCHKESGFFARGPLTRQNFMSIRFMVENKLMPPPGFTLKPQEKQQIEQFINL